MNAEELIMLYHIRVEPCSSIVWARIGNHEAGAKYCEHKTKEHALRYAIGSVMLKAAERTKSVYPSVKVVEDLAAQVGVTYGKARKALIDASGDMAIAFDLLRYAR